MFNRKITRNVQFANLFWCQDISAPHPVTLAIDKLTKSRDVIMSSTAMSPGFVFMQVEYNGGAQILIDCYFQLRRWVSCLSTWRRYPSSNCALQNWSAENEALLNIDLKAFHLVQLIEIGNMMCLVKDWWKYYSSTIKNDHIANTGLVTILVILQGLCQLLQGEGGPQGEQAWQVGARRGQFFIDGN